MYTSALKLSESFRHKMPINNPKERTTTKCTQMPAITKQLEVRLSLQQLVYSGFNHQPFLQTKVTQKTKHRNAETLQRNWETVTKKESCRCPSSPHGRGVKWQRKQGFQVEKKHPLTYFRERERERSKVLIGRVQ